MRKIVFFVFVISVSCNKSNKLVEVKDAKDVMSFNITLKSIQKNNLPFINASVFIDSIRYVHLEYSNNSIVGEITDVHYYKNNFYIHDRITSSILIFNNSGSFISKIHKLGKGPDEYITISAFDVNPISGTINIYDGARRKMLEYSNEGVLIKEFSTGHDIIRDFSILPSGDYLFYTPDYNINLKRGLWKVDKNGIFKKQLITIANNYRYGGLYPHYLYRISKNLIGLMGGEDKNKIYHITDNGVVTKYRINVDIKIPNYLKEKLSTEFDFNDYPGKVYTKNNYVETVNWLFFTVTDFKKKVVVLYDKKNNILRTTSVGIINDVDSIAANSAGGVYNVYFGKVPVDLILENKRYSKKFPFIKDYSENSVLQIVTLK